MSEDTYLVETLGVVIARGMSLGTALIVVKAMMQEFYNDPTIEYTIKREDNAVMVREDDLVMCDE